MTTVYRVTGMKCDNCAKHVQEALSNVKGVESATVDLAEKTVTIQGKPWTWSLKRALKGSKYALGEKISG